MRKICSRCRPLRDDNGPGGHARESKQQKTTKEKNKSIYRQVRAQNLNGIIEKYLNFEYVKFNSSMNKVSDNLKVNEIGKQMKVN